MKEILNKIGYNINILLIIMFSYYSVVVYFLMGIDAYCIFVLPILIVLAIMKYKYTRKSKK